MKKLTVKEALSLGPNEVRRLISTLDIANRYLLAMGIAGYAAREDCDDVQQEAMKAAFDSFDEPGIVLSAWRAFQMQPGAVHTPRFRAFGLAVRDAIVTGVFGVPVGPTCVGVHPNVDKRTSSFIGPDGFDPVTASVHYMGLVAAARASGNVVIEIDERVLGVE